MTEPTAPDPAAAYLAIAATDIDRAMNRPQGFDAAMRVMKVHAPRLLGALEAVLAEADKLDTAAAEIWAQVQLEDCDGAIAGFNAIGATARQCAATDIRTAIRAALLGEGDTDGNGL